MLWIASHFMILSSIALIIFFDVKRYNYKKIYKIDIVKLYIFNKIELLHKNIEK